MRYVSPKGRVGKMALLAAQEGSALWNHRRRKGKLLAVENDHVVSFKQVLFAISALLLRFRHIIHHRVRLDA